MVNCAGASLFFSIARAESKVTRSPGAENASRRHVSSC